jgi:hypothetical protein
MDVILINGDIIGLSTTEGFKKMKITTLLPRNR